MLSVKLTLSPKNSKTSARLALLVIAPLPVLISRTTSLVVFTWPHFRRLRKMVMPTGKHCARIEYKSVNYELKFSLGMRLRCAEMHSRLKRGFSKSVPKHLIW